MKKRISQLHFLLLLFACFAPLHANTVKWIIMPQDEQIELYCDGVYLYHDGARIALMDDAGSAIQGSECDSITPCDKNGYSLLLDLGGSEAMLVGIFNGKHRKVISLKEKGLKVKKDYAFFSDSRLPIKNDSGKWGYLDLDGNIVIPCEYIKAKPFFSNCAPVQMENQVSKYINQNGKLAFTVGFKDANINDATPFFSNGTADVAAGGRSFARIDRKGKKVKDLNVNEYRKNSEWLSDYRKHVENEPTIPKQNKTDFPELVKSQLTIFQVQQGQAIVKTTDGKIGVLKLLPEDFVLSEPTLPTFNGKTKGKKQTIATMRLEIPEGLSLDDLTFEIDKGDGQLREIEAKDYKISDDKKTVTFEFTPNVKAKSKEVSLGLVVKHHDLILLKNNNISVKIHPSEPDPPEPETCQYCGKKQHSWSHTTCTVCGYYTGDVLRENKCGANGHHTPCPYPKCKKYISKKYKSGYKKNICLLNGNHPRPTKKN